MTSPALAPSDCPHEVRTSDGDLILLTHNVLDESALVNSVKDPKAGAVCSFIGTTRDTFEGQALFLPSDQPSILLPGTDARLAWTLPFLPFLVDKVVTHLSYQSYVPLCLSTLRSIALSAHSHPSLLPPSKIHHVVLAHRLGVVPTGETSIVIAVSGSHRRESFEVCEFLLEEVKKKAQIWKREVYADGRTVEGAVDGGSEPQSAWKENFKDGKW